MTLVKNRYDFVFLWDVKNGNPNGDPDFDNMPRIDAESQIGLTTDGCIKSKVKHFVSLKHSLKTPYNIFVRKGNTLNELIEASVGETKQKQQNNMCENYWDIRTFGAVLTTGKNIGEVRGPVQFVFSESIDKIFQAYHSITRCAVATIEEKEEQKKRENPSTFGSKKTVPYGLYRMHGFVSAFDAQKTGFTEEDLELLWESLINAFEHDRSAARGEMNPRKLIVFKHDSELGNARSGELFEKVIVEKNNDLPRKWSDYSVRIDKNLPSGITLIEKL